MSIIQHFYDQYKTVLGIISYVRKETKERKIALICENDVLFDPESGHYFLDVYGWLNSLTPDEPEDEPEDDDSSDPILELICETKTEPYYTDKPSEFYNSEINDIQYLPHLDPFHSIFISPE